MTKGMENLRVGTKSSAEATAEYGKVIESESENVGNIISPGPLYRGLVTLLGWLLPRLAPDGLIVVDIYWSNIQTMCLDHPIIVYIIVV